MVVIPETQLFKSPTVSIQADRKNDWVSDCEEIVIPDTPEVSKVVTKGKKAFGRSFLTSSVAIGKKPGLTKSEIIQKKRLSRARKSLVSISINNHVNGNVTDESSENWNIDKIELIDETSKDVRDDNMDSSGICHEASLLMENASQIFVKTNIKSNSDTLQDQSLENKNLQNDLENVSKASLKPVTATMGVSPTKVYETSIKRMSKTGESPVYKRLAAQGDSKSDDELTIDKDKVKRNLCGVKISEKKKIKPKISAVNNYQLTMSARKKNESQSVTTVNDDVLGELLGELDSKTNAKSVMFIDENTPLTTLRLKNRMSLATCRRGPRLTENSEVSEEEQMLFQTLDKEIHAEFLDAKNASASVKCAEPSTTYKSSSVEPEPSLSTTYKSSSVKPEPSLSTFPEAQVQDVEKEAMDIELVGTPDDSDDEKTATQNIKEFATQQSKHPSLADDIEEFHSQMDDSLCEGLDALSPFKTKAQSTK